jgi:hypothetical protein
LSFDIAQAPKIPADQVIEPNYDNEHVKQIIAELGPFDYGDDLGPNPEIEYK